MIRVFLLVIFCVVLHFDGGKASKTNVNKLDDDPDRYRNVSELITSKGYPVEEHTVQTADGYLLSVQRVPYGRNETVDIDKKQVVLLIHGLLCDASIWVIDFPDKSLGFVLPDAGYDTWLLNTRGGTYSRKHVNFTTNQLKFWDFSFDEMAQYDIPATIDYILSVTGKEALHIIANSQGSSAVFAMFSEMAEYNDKVKLCIGFAPVAYVWHYTSDFKYIAPYAKEITLLSNLFYSGEFLPNTGFLKKFRKLLIQVAASEIFQPSLFSFAPIDPKLCNQTRFGVYAAHYAASCSVKSLNHYAQLAESKKFRKFDYGRYNFEHYNQEEPPDYDLSRITAPVALIWSAGDKIADPKDIDILRKQLKSLVFDYCIPYKYNHGDFFIAQNLPEMVVKPVLQLLAQF